jgi:hypothetical protein
MDTVEVRNLAGVAEVAWLFGVRRTTVSNWSAHRSGAGFPEPVVRLASGPVFDLSEISAWYAGYSPLKGRKPGSAAALSGGVWVRGAVAGGSS